MQFGGNFTNQPDRNSNKLKLILIVVLLSISVVGIVIISTLPSNNDAPEVQPDSGQYEDPITGETVSDPENKSPETYGTDDPGIVYLGFTKLTDIGASMNHVGNSEKAFEFYSEEREEKITEVSVYPESIKRGTYNENTGVRTINYEVLVNREDRYQVEMEYIGLIDSRTKILKNKKVVFTSGILDESELHGG